MRPPPQCSGNVEGVNFGHVDVSELGVGISMAVAAPLHGFAVSAVVLFLTLPLFVLGLTTSLSVRSVETSPSPRI